jgi:hypothetical protein
LSRAPWQLEIIQPEKISMLTYILVAFVLLVLVALGLAARQPDDFRVTRSATIPAAPAVVFAQVNDLHLWEAWSPWAKLDPNAKNAFEGPAAGVGSAMSWIGNSKVGQGRMAITASRPTDFIQFQLDFLKPMKATHTAEFTFKPDGAQTVVTWSMFGKNKLPGKIFGLFVDCDKMIGAQFEAGLASLKDVAVGKS